MVARKYYTPNEVSVHNTLEDCWVSYLGKVYNLTKLLENQKGMDYQIHFLGSC